MRLSLGSGLGLFLFVVFVVYFLATYLRVPSYAPPVRGTRPAMLPCLADGHCPEGQTCAGGFCVERFMNVPAQPGPNMASCDAKSCQGINQPCARKDSPCPEGTFCQKNNCVQIAAPDRGEAYGQIGTIDLN